MRPASFTILDAMDHPEIFGPHFHGETWQAWRSFLAAMFAFPMDANALATYTHHTGRQTPPLLPFREASLVCGRRAGKSRVLALIAVFLACFKDYMPHLAAGEMATVAIIASDRRQARGILRYILGLLRAVPALEAMLEGETNDGVVLSNRVVIEIHTASFRVTRGYTFAAVLCDEVAFWRSDDSANPDVEILTALRPGLSSIPGSVLLKASSPYAKRGVLWNDFKNHHGRDDARVLVWRGTTAEMNPSIDAALIEAAYEDDPQNAAAEYGAEFRGDIAAFVDRMVVDACVEPGCFERARNMQIARNYLAFVDAAGGSGSDSMTCAIAHLEEGVPVLDAVRERKPPFSPDDVVTEFSELLKSYNVRSAEADRWGGDWVGEAFRKQGITVVPSTKPKSDLYREVLPLLNAGRCSLLDLPRLVTQLCGLERRTARGGRDSIDHAPGGHDDLANAVAGVLVMSGTVRPPMRISAEALATICKPTRGSPAWLRRFG